MKETTALSRRLFFLAGALLFTAPRNTLPAQGPGLFDVFAARKESPSDPLFGGLALTGYSGIFGLRLSGALNFNNGDNSTVYTAPSPYTGCDRFRCRGYGGPQHYRYESGLGIGVGGWSADADLLVAPLRALPLARSLLLGFSPYGFVGIGGIGVNPNNAPDTSRATWSFGVGLHHDLLGWLGVGAEARNRRSLHSDSAIAIGSRRNWEYRAGLSVSFGAHHDPVPSTAPRGILMPVDRPETDQLETAESAPGRPRACWILPRDTSKRPIARAVPIQASDLTRRGSCSTSLGEKVSCCRVRHTRSRSWVRKSRRASVRCVQATCSLFW